MKRTGMYIFEDHLSKGINEVPLHATVVVINYFDETKILTKLSNDGLTSDTPIQEFIEREELWKYLGKPSELELIEENGVEGWRLYKRDPLNYGVIGKDAIDLSLTDGGFEASGATGVRSFASGENSHAMGDFSHCEGLTTKHSVELITGPIGGGGQLPEGAVIYYGRPEGSTVYYGVPEGAVIYYGRPEGYVTYFGATSSG